MTKTSIEWTHRPETGGAKGGYSWNPIRARRKDILLDKDGRDANGTRQIGWACTHASTGCLHCYAEAINKRFGTGLPFSVPALEQVEFFLDEKELQAPLRLKKRATIFVGDMFDLFHEQMPLSFIAEIFNVMGAATLACSHRGKQQHDEECWMGDSHTFQVLTKRAARMQEVLTNALPELACNEWPGDSCLAMAYEANVPFENMWLGVSCENQKYADERIELLQRTPAAVRFLSIEPQLEEVWIKNHLTGMTSCGRPDWVICGGESGPRARPFDLAWAESLRDQCKAADVPFFMKQVGSKPIVTCQEHSVPDVPHPYPTKDRKGGDPSEWPESLRIREWPAETAVPA
jgi:protein gp37